MKSADLYIRVSTDEQADKGYSQRDQEDRLRKYCELNAINIRKVVFEDYSAKTFNRPQWNKLLSDFRKCRGQIDLILFTKWDRFSRNAGDAYRMISTLRKFGVDPQAVEQPLDLTIPENKMMLAFYLAAPEVENDRRALNVIYGMRRAKKEGRWMGTAPLGYINKTGEDGRKYIIPEEPNASLIKWAFQQIAKKNFATDQIRQELNKKGLKCSRSNFWTLIRNPVYYGKIFIPKFKDEESCFVPGQHEPLISESLFYEVQDKLEGKRRKERPNAKINCNEHFPLRGFLICPRCNRMLTGSASKGEYDIYYYYHCISSCGCRYRASVANEAIVSELKRFIPKEGVMELYKLVVKNVYTNRFAQKRNEIKQINEDIDKLNIRLAKARELLISSAIEPGDYRIIKLETENSLKRLEAKLLDISTGDSPVNIDQLLSKATNTIMHLDDIYTQADIKSKRAIISSIYPEKLSFDGKQYRTTRINEALLLIYQINNALPINKNRKAENVFCLSGKVVPTRIELVSKV